MPEQTGRRPWAGQANLNLWTVYKGHRPDGLPQWVGYVGRDVGRYHTCHGGDFPSLDEAVRFVGYWGCPVEGGPRG